MKLSKHYLKFLFRISITLIVLSATQFFYSCTSSDEPEIDAQRIQDSLEVYTLLDKAMSSYIQALNNAEEFDDEEASRYFEATLKTLRAIDSKILDAPGNVLWRKDFNEISVSVVQDYLNTQHNIPENSLVFRFADDLSISYEVIKEKTEDEYVNEPLPDGSNLPLVRNSAVDGYIEFFTNTERGRNFIDRTMYRSGKFFPLMRKILRYHGAPEENIYLSIQESGLDPKIVSRAGAVGLWQFMPATGMAYGLYQDSYRDDRRDFEKATDAAARHLNDLYRSFGDWYLAWAAYNAGPGRVNTAIRRSGSRDFWVLRQHLPGETKNYVPSILALSFVYRNPEQYGFKELEFANPLSFDRVNIKARVSFQRIAELCGTDLETIRELNPELFDDEIPLYDVPYMLRIPVGTYETFAENYRNANDIEKNYMNTPEFAGYERFGFGSVASTKFTVRGYNPPDPRKIISIDGKIQLVHTYMNNEELSSIASKYSVRTTDLRIWNALNYGMNPTNAQPLVVYVNAYPSGYKPEENTNENLTTTSENLTETVQTVSYTENTTQSIETETQFQDKSPRLRDFQRKRNDPDYQIPETKTEIKTVVTTPPVTENVSSYETPVTENKPITENITKPTTTVKTETTVNTSNTTRNEVKAPEGKKNVHVVKEGDMLGIIATSYGVRVSDIMEWNNLSDDKILIGQKLNIYSDKSVTGNNTTRPQVHEVSAGENLTMIASRYSVSVSDLIRWNDLSSDVIHVGQKLSVSAQKTSGKTNTQSKHRTYKVQTGDNLTKIAQQNKVTVSQLKQWNDLDSDVIHVGQVLKIY